MKKRIVEMAKGVVILFSVIAIWLSGVRAEETQKVDITNIAPKEEPTYSSTGKRDPFKPFIKIIEKKEAEPQLSKSVPPIKRYSLEQFKLVGIVSVGTRPKAMIVDPEKNTYVLGVGDEIGNKHGKIVEVKDNGILVEEKRYFEDVFGQNKVETRKSSLAFKEE
jgi:Tfp pilus assembly protein PilP